MRSRNPRRKRLAQLAALIAAGAAAGTAQAATNLVNSLADATVATNGQCTLREALNNANGDNETTGGDCTPGSGADVIQFLAGLTGTELLEVDEDLVGASFVLSDEALASVATS